jgi:glycogen debranching enzyme
VRPQPFLHELVSVLAAPTVALSGADGQIRAGGTQGVICADRRLLAECVLTLDGTEPTPLGRTVSSAGAATFSAIARHLGDPGADPTVRVDRRRTAHPDGVTETVTLTSTAHHPVRTRLALAFGSDLAGMPDIRSGHPTTPVPVERPAGGTWRWAAPGSAATLRTEPAPDTGAEPAWDVMLAPGASWTLTLYLSAETDRRPPFHPAAPPWSPAAVRSADGDLDRLVARGLGDLAGLTLTDSPGGTDAFLGAGSPWFFTLFGRDSLWAARMLLPLGTELAAGTLRVLARHQGTRYDERTGEAPGKIIHEVRDADLGGGLPSRYYGTIDATALWICTLHDAWRWGLPEPEVRALLDPLRAALDWLTGPADPDGDGFLEYVDATGAGLANQGWKDSGDAIQWPDGHIAEPPIALSEAQAYAHEAAVAGAALLADTDPRRAAELRAWAGELADRFRARFWVHDAYGEFPALALDAGKTPVPVATSNLGHLLGTGLLTGAETARVAARLAAGDLADAHGLRTFPAGLTGSNPLGYHTGSVWPHDTAIAVSGLARTGHHGLAARLAANLLTAAPAFEHRLPELFAGTALDQPVLAYPAACRPQSWAAAAPVMLLTAALGLTPDVPAGTLTVRPDPAFSDWFPLIATDLRIAGHPLSIRVDATGQYTVDTTAPVRVSPGR